MFSWLQILKLLGLIILSAAGLWFVFYLICWLILIALCLPISMKKEYKVPSPFYGKVMNFGYWVLCGNARIRMHASGLDKVPDNEHFLLVSNHRSSFDNMVQTYLLKKELFSYVTKQENFKIPIGRHFMKKLCYPSLNRGDIRSAVTVINKASSFIQNGYCSIGLFPEGTRTKDGKVGEFRPGCFKIVLKAKCPIVVSVTTGTEMVHRNWPWKRTHVYFDVLKVIPFSEIEGKTTVEIAENVRNCIIDELRKKGADAGSEYNEEYYHL